MRAKIDLRRLTSVAMLSATALAAALAIAFHDGFAFSVTPLVAPNELHLDFAATPVALPFLMLIALVVPAVAIWCLQRGARADGARLAAFVLAMIAVVLAQSVAAFFIAWEAMSFVSAFLVGAHHERRDVRRALLSYPLVSQLGALCIVAALALLGAHAGSFRFADIARAAPALPADLRSVVLALAVIGFGSKAGLVPLHFWLPLAHPVAPANASALLSGVMLKVAVYGLLVTCFTLAAPIPPLWSAAIVAVGLITAITGALYAAVDSDFKRLLAYSSIEHMGISVSALGLALVAAANGQTAIADFALVALLAHVVAHGIFKSLLFLGAGTVAETAHTTDLEHLGGLRLTLPLTTWLVLAGCASAAALPPLVGFTSEWLVLGSFVRLLPALPAIQALVATALAILAVTGGLGALAFVKLFGMAFLGEPRRERRHARERIGPAVVALGWLATLASVFGVAPTILLGPLARVAAALGGGNGAFAAGTLPGLPVLVAFLPLAGGVAVVLAARLRGVRQAPARTCGSSVTSRSQYTATAFSKPVRRIFGFVLFPDHQEIRDVGTSRWFPVRIRYEFSTRYVIDEVARNVAAIGQRLARRTRIVQAGLLRVYLIYAVVAVLVLLIVAR